jgi:hypothetical protein
VIGDFIEQYSTLRSWHLDAPFMKVGIGDLPNTSIIKFDLDHSLPVGVEYVRSTLVVRPKY